MFPFVAIIDKTETHQIKFRHITDKNPVDPSYNIPKRYKDMIFVSKIEKDMNKLLNRYIEYKSDGPDTTKQMIPFFNTERPD